MKKPKEQPTKQSSKRAGHQAEEETYEERESADRDLARALDLKYLEQMLESLPKRKREKKHMLVGGRAFSAQDMFEEIREDKAYCDYFRAILRQMRLAPLRGARQ